MTTIDREAPTRLLTHPVVATLATVFSDAGFQLLLVGGSVRDALTGDTVDDLDFTTDARPEQTRELISPLGPIWEAGSAFGTLGVVIEGEKVEITTFRAEQYDGMSRKPEVDFSTRVEDDLVRRDLTINAIALDVVGGQLVDPFGGAADLERGVLRCPGDPQVTMSEDPLRQVRVVRFAARTGFRVDEQLRDAIVATRHRLEIVARERITAELRKMLAAGPRRMSDAVQLAAELRIDRAIFGDLAHDEAQAALRAAQPDAPPLAVLAFRRRDADDELRSLKLFGDEITEAVVVAKFAARLVITDPSDLPTVRTLARYAVRGGLAVDVSATVAQAYGHDVTETVAAVRRCIEAEPDVTADLPINGNDLLAAGLRGPSIGAALRAVETALMQSGALDRDTALQVALAA